jgi:hypothetical protein
MMSLMPATMAEVFVRVLMARFEAITADGPQLLTSDPQGAAHAGIVLECHENAVQFVGERSG